jgi:CO/xanthine dehydrogenase FAD-binding subunit
MDFDVISPKTKEELLNAISDYQGKDFCFGAGYTDLINQFKHESTVGKTVINLAQLSGTDFKGIREHNGRIEIGALTTASNLIDSEIIKNEFPVIIQSAESVASTQIRNTATIGGNICNASPSADMAAAFVAIKAVCCILDSEGNEREESLESFIRGVRKIGLKENEILKSIIIPKNNYTNLKSGFLKVGTRESMEISIVSLSYHFQLDEDDKIMDAGIAIGAVSPVIPFAEEACNLIKAKRLNEFIDYKSFADAVQQYASPISDIRATDWYRREVLNNLCQSIFE